MSATTQSAMSVDDWRPGLRFGVKALNTKTVKRAAAPGDVLPVCLAHNLREGNQDHRHRGRIDPSRTKLNEVWAGPQRLDVAVALVRDTLDSLDIRPKRRDAIMGVELVFQPPYGVELSRFWSACLEWAKGRYEHIVSATVHHDQKRPHMHVLALAVSGGRLAGNEMTASPNRPKQRRADFMAYMRHALGLRPDRAVKTLGDLAASTGKGPKTRAEAERRDAAMLRKAAESSERAEVAMGVGGLRGSVAANGDPNSPQPPVIAHLSPDEKARLLWALIDDLRATPSDAAEPAQAAPLTAQGQAVGDLLRERDDDMPADWWDADQGEFRPQPPPQSAQKAAARAWVSTALQNIKRKPAGLPFDQ
ncbi:MAG: plasmid recombination protein [Pseudomonadota bacterium]